MNKKGLMLILSTAIISGFSIFINKYSVSVINPYVFTFLKNAVVALMLSSTILLVKDWKLFKRFTKKQWLLLLAIGLVGGSVPFLLFFKGLSITSAAQGSFIQKTMFIYVFILAAIFLKEKISKNFLIGALLLMLGNIILLKTLSFSVNRGDLMIFLATFLWAIENLISKYALKDMPGRTVAWGRMFFGSIFIFGYLGLVGQVSLVANLNIHQIGWTLVTSGLLFGYVMTWYSGLKHVSVSMATAILMIGSPITTLLSLMGGAKISFRETGSMVLISAGLITIFMARFFVDKLKQRLRKVYVRA